MKRRRPCRRSPLPFLLLAVAVAAVVSMEADSPGGQDQALPTPIMLHQKDFNKNAGEPINLFEERVDMSKEITRDTYLEARKETSFAEVGTGVLPIQKYIDAGNEAGIPYILLEQDFTFLNQMDSVRISMESFRKYSGIEWS